MTNPFLQTALIGIGVIGLLGEAWHFVFDWCGRGLFYDDDGYYGIR